MKFYIAEKNIGPGATREDVDQLIQCLTAKGWNVAPGERANQVTDPSEVGEEQKILDRFADDFMACLEGMGK
jgi:hypothetical protein